MNIQCVILRKKWHIKKCKYKALTNCFSNHDFVCVKRDLRFFLVFFLYAITILFTVLNTVDFCWSDFTY